MNLAGAAMRLQCDWNFMANNYRLTISYDGTRYYGWEHQPNTDMTIQGKIETVLARMLMGEKIGAAADNADAEQIKEYIPEVLCAGRTDAGVHAEAMIASVRLATDKTPAEIKDYLNHYLPDDICIKDLVVAGDRFHARYNACGKTYRYRCYIGDTKPIFDRKYVYTLEQKPDVAAMKKAAALLIGEHDFRSFCSNPKMKKSTVRLVDRIDIVVEGDYLSLTYHGSGFLQYMVRIMTGTLLEVGWGKRTPESMTQLLEAKDRRLAGETAPAQGLTMVKVDY